MPNTFRDSSIQIVIYLAESVADHNFFTRFEDACNCLNYSLWAITNKPSIYFRCKKGGIKCIIIKKSAEYLKNFRKLNYRELSDGQISKTEAALLYSSTYNCLEKNINKTSIFFLWNGLSVIGTAINDFCKNCDIEIRYFELANIPNKIFVDKLGISANSKLYHNIELLDKYKINSDEFNRWKEIFLSFKRSSDVPPQAIQNIKIKNYLFLLDLIAFKYFNIPSNTYLSLKNRITRKENFYSQSDNFVFDEVDMTKTDFIFYPTQVSFDTQLLFFSNGCNNLNAIEFAIKVAKKKNLDLLVKIHPAETNFDEITSIFNLKKRLGFKIVNYNTTEILLNTKLVITINSTIGLEAKILGRPVYFLGDSIFKKMNLRRVISFIQNYLLDINYYDKSSIDSSKLIQIFGMH